MYLNWQFDDSGDYPIEKVILESVNLNGNTETFEKSFLTKINFHSTCLISHLKRRYHYSKFQRNNFRRSITK